jgi:hypothetical protein
LDRAPVRAVYRLTSTGRHAERDRRAADRDRDGAISAAEGNAAIDLRSSELIARLRVCRGDALDASNLECRTIARRDIELVEADGWSQAFDAHLHFTWTFQLGFSTADASALRFEDGDTTPGIETSDVSIVAPVEQPLIAAGDGPSAGSLTQRFNWIESARAPGPRVVVARWQKSPGRRWAAAVAVAAGVALAVLVAAFWLVRRRAVVRGRARSA